MRSLICFFLFIGSLHAQTANIILEKATDKYSSKEPMQFDTTYNFYKTQNSNKIHESYKGAYYKNTENESYTKINNTECYVTKNIAVQISHEEKSIIIVKPSNFSVDQYDISKLLQYFGNPTLKDRKTYWEIELIVKQFTSLPYSKIILHVGKDYSLQKQIIYYSTAINFSTDYSKPDFQYPRLEIIFGKLSKKPVPQGIFDTSKYFTYVNKKVKLTKEYMNYELIDQR